MKQSQKRDLINHLISIMGLRDASASKNYFRFERYKNNTSAERGAVKSPVSSDDAFSPDEVLMMRLRITLSMPAKMFG